jgi:hypothetical protein
MLGVGLDGSRRIQAAHVGCAFGPDGSRRIQKDRLDDQTDDQGLSDRIGCQGKLSSHPPPLLGLHQSTDLTRLMPSLVGGSTGCSCRTVFEVERGGQAIDGLIEDLSEVVKNISMPTAPFPLILVR